MASNGGMIIEQWTRKHAEGSSHDLIWNAIPTLPTVGYTLLTALSICLSVCIIPKSLQEYFDGNMWLRVYTEVHMGNVN
jgi:hypothetical protein